LIKATYHELPAAGRTDATQKHEQKLIHDIDLSVLAWAPTKYNEYVSLVRREHDISDDKWAKGRIKFLRFMLSRKCVFLTEEYRGSEDDARRNMCEELKAIRRNR
jgi:predicted metal-dependent HD superfamily phosphohydrolase